VPRHVARLILRLVALLIVDYSVSRRLIVSTTPPRAGSSLTTSPPLRVRVPRHVARLVAPLVIDYSASRRLIVD
jgi:hypothetical protein